MWRCSILTPGVLLAAGAAFGQGQMLLDDPLTGSTSGVRQGGAFVPEGWQVAGQTDFILWHFPTILRGAAEFSVRGLWPQECRPGLGDKVELFHMYDYTFGDSDSRYGGGYRDNPFKHFMRKTGCQDTRPNRTDSLEMLWKIGDNFEEPDTAPLTWDPGVTYRFREEWGPDGNGNSEIRTYRDGELIMTMSQPGDYAPVGHTVRIAASPRAGTPSGGPDFGAPLGAVFSGVKVWNLSGVPLPPVPPPGGLTSTPPGGGAMATLAGIAGGGGATVPITYNSLSSSSPSPATGTTAAQPPVGPQYTSGGNTLGAYSQTAAGGGSGSGGGGGGCWVAPGASTGPGGSGARLPLLVLGAVLAALVFVRLRASDGYVETTKFCRIADPRRRETGSARLLPSEAAGLAGRLALPDGGARQCGRTYLDSLS